MRLFDFCDFYLWTCTPLIFLLHVEARSEDRDAIIRVFPVESPVINTPSHQVHHRSHFDLTFSLHDKQQHVKLRLEPNHGIIAKTARIEVLDTQGNIKSDEPIHRPAYMVFKGSSWIQEADGSWDRVGWARIHLQKDGPRPLMEGAFSIINEIHHVQLQSTYLQTKRELDFNPTRKAYEHMVIHRDSDTAMKTPDLGLRRSSSDKLDFPLNQAKTTFNKEQVTTNEGSQLLRRRSSNTYRDTDSVDLGSTIGITAGCPSERRVATIGIATDCSYTSSFDSVQAVRRNIISMVNTASEAYERSLNIALSIQDMTVSNSSCPSTAPESSPWNMPCTTGNLSHRLDLFSIWRASRADDNAYWTLLSTCSTGGMVGLAWVGQLCMSQLSISNTQSQPVTGANVVVRTPTEWQVFAHESGHTFGAVHDCDSSTCPINQSSPCCPLSTSDCDARDQYIMSPAASRSISNFSPCTIGNICSAMGQNRVISNCLDSDDGRCSNGHCDGIPTGNGTPSWVDNHRDLVIGLASGLGSLLLIIVGCSIFGCYRKHRNEKCSIPIASFPQPPTRYRYS